MSETKHTALPWSFEGRIVSSANRGKFIQQICEVGLHGCLLAKEDIANARLIAAAPDLLDAARAVRVWVALAIGRDPNETHPKAIQNAKDDLEMLDSAIAKAREVEAALGGKAE